MKNKRNCSCCGKCTNNLIKIEAWVGRDYLCNDCYSAYRNKN